MSRHDRSRGIYLNGTAPRLAVVFLHWQRIHIGARRPKAFMPVTHLQCADHTGFRQAAMNLISPFLKQSCNAIARVVPPQNQFQDADENSDVIQ